MNRILNKNLANIIVLVRILFLFAAIMLLNAHGAGYKIAGLIALTISLILDWLDGYVAQKNNIITKTGALLDTLGDRITENLLLIFFAYKHIIPVYAPLVFVARSFLADFIRLLNFRNGLSTFAVNKSYWGQFLVASRLSRSSYLIIKIGLFCAAYAALFSEQVNANSLPALQAITMLIPGLTAAAVTFCLLRFFLLVYDSRKILADEFLR